MTYKIHITLSGSRPKIWRRILVGDDLLWEEDGETAYEGVVLSDLLKEPVDKMHYEWQ